MPHQLQLVFEGFTSVAEKKKHLARMLKEELESDSSYQGIKDKCETAASQMKELKNKVNLSLEKDVQELERLDSKLKTEKEKLTNAALSTYVSGKTTTVKDGENEYVPIFSARFKKLAKPKKKK